MTARFSVPAEIALDAGAGKLVAGGIEVETRHVLENLVKFSLLPARA